MGCDLPGKPRPEDRPVPPDQVVEFCALYRENCAGCHGTDGKEGPAPPLNEPHFLAIIPETELVRVIRDGRPGTPMPAFARDQGGPLTADQVKALAEGLKPHWGTPEPLTGQPPPYLAPPDELGRASTKQGAKVFDRACASCHGDHGQLHRINDPVFLALISDQALRRYAITGRPDFGMPGYAGKRPDADDFRPLTSQEITDLVAFLASWRQGSSARGKEKELGFQAPE
jgi:cytochrome c oxidase cbb3-type subunit 3/ubiquinol-cytochrome c reductase cytochrome c subunit